MVSCDSNTVVRDGDVSVAGVGDMVVCCGDVGVGCGDAVVSGVNE